ncbi:hypothetical protein ACEQ8H_005264, partial [Pleosporales sp. CAS-2024a]
MAPSQYGLDHYPSSSSYPQNYAPGSQHGYMEHRSSTSGPYDASYTCSPALSHDARRSEDQNVLPPYQSHSQMLSRSPYQQQPSNTIRPGPAPLASNAPGYVYNPAHGNHANPQFGSNDSHYPA